MRSALLRAKSIKPDILSGTKATALEPHQKPIYDALGIQPDAGGFVKKVI